MLFWMTCRSPTSRSVPSLHTPLKRNKSVNTFVPLATVFHLLKLHSSTAQQEAQRASYIVDRARQEKQSIIVRAEGEAQSATLIGEAIKNNPGFLQLRRIETARDIAGTVAGSSNRVFLDSDALLLNTNGEWIHLFTALHAQTMRHLDVTADMKKK